MKLNFFNPRQTAEINKGPAPKAQSAFVAGSDGSVPGEVADSSGSAVDPTQDRLAVKLLAHIDGTDADLQLSQVNRLDELERTQAANGGKLAISAQFYRSVTPASLKLAIGGLELTAALGVPLLVGGAALYGGHPLVGVSLGLGIGGLCAAGGILTDGIRKLGNGLKELKAKSPEPVWRGKRVYDVVCPDRVPGRIDSPVSEEIKGGRLRPIFPSSESYAQFLTRNLDPKARNVVYIGGHGGGYHKTAGFKTRELGESFQTAIQRSGVQPSLLLAESCYEGNWEGLSDLVGAAKYVIASQELMSLGHFNLHEAVSEAVAHSDSDEAVARAVFQSVGKSVTPGGNQSLALLNLQKLPILNDAMGLLATRLTTEIQANPPLKQPIRGAADGAMAMPNSPVIKQLMPQTGFSDLGMFLQGLEKAGLSEESISLLSQVKRAFGEVVVAKQMDELHQPCSGLSYEKRPNSVRGALRELGQDQEQYNETKIPQSWKDFQTELWR